MSQFICPKCSAQVTPSNDEDRGCPCCGYLRDAASEAQPYYPIPMLPYQPSDWVWPEVPWQPTIICGDTKTITTDTKITCSC